MSRSKFLVVAAVVLCAVATIYVASSRTSQVALESDNMLQPYFAWEAEKEAKAQDSLESADLSSPDSDSSELFSKGGDTEQLAVSIPHIDISHAHVHDEMITEFKDRDLLTSIKNQLKQNAKPRVVYSLAETHDQADKSALDSQIQHLEMRKKQALIRLNNAEKIADPLLKRANILFQKTHSIQEQYQAALSQAKDTMNLGENDLQKAVQMRHDFFTEEQPVEDAQVAADNAAHRYRVDALRFANSMLIAEKIGKNPKLRSAAEKKLDTLRAQLNVDEVEKRHAMKRLENAQGNMHVQAGLQDYNRWRLKGENLVNKGKTLLEQAHEIKSEEKLWEAPLKKAQRKAAEAETQVHSLRVREQNIAKAERKVVNKKKAIIRNEKEAAEKLENLEKEQVELREKGAKLMKQYHTLIKDVKKREKKRAEMTEKQAENNNQVLKSLLAQN